MLLAAGSALLIGGGIVMAAALYQQNQRKPFVAAVPAAPARSAIQNVRMTTARPVEAPAPLAALPGTLEWPASVPQSSSKALASAALLQACGIGDRAGVDLCQQAESAGLSCRTARGGLGELRHLNRPAMLHMRNHRGQEFYATLTTLDDEAATFAIGNETVAVALGALASQWSGSYTVLWRLPPDTQRNIRLGERGPSVEWLSKHLALTQGGDMKTTPDPVFDADLLLQVKQFQLAQGLVPDGIVGSQTLIRLSGVADQAAPKLIAVRGED
jgi:general secretion pathway protein A